MAPAPNANHYRLVNANSRIASVSDGLAGIQANEFDFAVVSDWVWGDVGLMQDVGRLVCVHPVSGAMLFVNRASRAAHGLDAVRRGVPPGADCESVRRAQR